MTYSWRRERDSVSLASFRFNNIREFRCHGSHICHGSRATLHRLHRRPSIPCEAAKAHRGLALLSWPARLFADSMTVAEPPLPNLLGFIADEEKVGIPSLADARPRGDHSLGPNPGFFESALCRWPQQDAATERLVLKRARVQIAGLQPPLSAALAPGRLICMAEASASPPWCVRWL